MSHRFDHVEKKEKISRRFDHVPDDVVEIMFNNLSWSELARQSSISKEMNQKVKNYLEHLAMKKDENGISLLCKMHTNCDMSNIDIKNIKNKLTEELKLDCWEEVCEKKRMIVIESFVLKIATGLVELCIEYLRQTPSVDKLTYIFGANSRFPSDNTYTIKRKRSGEIQPNYESSVEDQVSGITCDIRRVRPWELLQRSDKKDMRIRLFINIRCIESIREFLLEQGFVLDVNRPFDYDDEDTDILEPRSIPQICHFVCRI